MLEPARRGLGRPPRERHRKRPFQGFTVSVGELGRACVPIETPTAVVQSSSNFVATATQTAGHLSTTGGA